MSALTVSRLAERVGTAPDTVRYYERIGLVSAPERTKSGYRLYGEEEVERLLFIKRAQGFGLRLEEIRELLAVRDRGLCPCGRTRTLLEQRLVDVDEQMASLEQLRGDIATMLTELPADSEGWRCGSSLLTVEHAPPDWHEPDPAHHPAHHTDESVSDKRPGGKR